MYDVLRLKYNDVILKVTSKVHKRSKKMDESSSELSDVSDQLSDITEIISDVETDESDIDAEEDTQPAHGRNVNPWFSVIDRETFQLNVEGFTESTGPTGFEPNYTPVEYFEKFLSTEDEDLIDRLVDETNW